jgi:hypothetical protein
MNRARVFGIPRRLYRRSRDLRQSREERRFDTRVGFDSNAPELILSPHLDDAVLDCWNLLASERSLRVVNVFAGIPAPGRLTLWDAITGAEDSAQRVKERIAEDAIAMARAGREPANLAFLDAQYRQPPSLALSELDRAIAAEAPSASRVYVPAGVGSHPDHLLVRRYGRMLLRTGMPVTLYADLPYCVFHGWPHWVDGQEPEPTRNVDAFWGSFLDGVPEMGPLRSARVVSLDPAAAAAKLEAMRCYRTQFAGLDYAARDVISDPAIHGFEVCWELGGGRASPAPRAEGERAQGEPVRSAPQSASPAR